MKNKLKGTWGGARKKKTPKKEPTKVMRIPISKEKEVLLIIGKK
jgi:hypothetical protein